MPITFKEVAEYFNSKKITWWLTSGSLLGAVREGKMIKGDTDIDIGILAEDFPKIDDFGNGKVKEWYWCYGKDPIINVQAWKTIGNKRYYCEDDWLQQELPENIGFVQIEFEGVMCNIPANYETLLNDWFSDWKTPMPEVGRTRIYKLINGSIKQVKWENQWQHYRPSTVSTTNKT